MMVKRREMRKMNIRNVLEFRWSSRRVMQRSTSLTPHRIPFRMTALAERIACYFLGRNSMNDKKCIAQGSKQFLRIENKQKSDTQHREQKKVWTPSPTRTSSATQS
mmetsp:Transcript_36952/g.42990  ORF Transcript_36952/g.42990 Transcript_36952/m.42990 type:complete len:106 (-) Transcript_36952:113-430(-)